MSGCMSWSTQRPLLSPCKAGQLGAQHRAIVPPVHAHDPEPPTSTDRRIYDVIDHACSHLSKYDTEHASALAGKVGALQQTCAGCGDGSSCSRCATTSALHSG